MYKKILLIFCLIIFSGGSLFAQTQDNILIDQNSDGIVSYVGFGDSITFGVGDTDPSLGGYVLRLGNLLGINAVNQGIPGEQLLTEGVPRFPALVRNSSSDIVGIMEGANDAIFKASATAINQAYQTIVNVARAQGKQIVIMTLPPPCCDRTGLAPFTDSYSQSVLEIISLNPDIRLADIRRAWRTTCQNLSECELYNLPEGLHPNAKGYDVIAQTVAASILGIDIFAADGAANLEAALGLPVGSVVVKPEAQI